MEKNKELLGAEGASMQLFNFSSYRGRGWVEFKPTYFFPFLFEMELAIRNYIREQGLRELTSDLFLCSSFYYNDETKQMYEWEHVSNEIYLVENRHIAKLNNLDLIFPCECLETDTKKCQDCFFKSIRYTPRVSLVPCGHFRCL